MPILRDFEATQIRLTAAAREILVNQQIGINGLQRASSSVPSFDDSFRSDFDQDYGDPVSSRFSTDWDGEI